jgi:sugar phosphate isomerase/epimerase
MPSRRQFLATAAALPALAFPSGGLKTPGYADLKSRGYRKQPAASPRRGPKIGTVTYNIAKDWDVDTIIKNLTAVRMDGVELRTTHKHGVELSLTPGQRAEVRKKFEDSTVKLAGLGTICEYHSPDAAVVRKWIEETKQWCQLARDVGSPSVKVRPNGLPKDVPEEKTLEQIGRSLKECGDAARDNGVAIQLEVHGEGTSRLPRIRKILDYGGNHPAVKVCWNSNQADLLDGGFAKNFALVQKQIGQVHMRDLFLEEYPWRDLITALHDMKFEGFCFAEIPESPDPMRVLRYFRGTFLAFSPT